MGPLRPQAACFAPGRPTPHANVTAVQAVDRPTEPGRSSQCSCSRCKRTPAVARWSIAAKQPARRGGVSETQPARSGFGRVGATGSQNDRLSGGVKGGGLTGGWFQNQVWKDPNWNQNAVRQEPQRTKEKTHPKYPKSSKVPLKCLHPRQL